MKVVVWIVEGTWRACVDAARDTTPAEADTVLLYVVEDEVSSVAHGAFAGLFGRGHPDLDPGTQVDTTAATAAQILLGKASHRMDRVTTSRVRRGRIEQEVIRSAEDADLLIVSRDGDRTHLGPKSLGRVSRFVVDHAPCAVLLVWPESAPSIDTAPYPPPPPQPHPKRPPPPPRR